MSANQAPHHAPEEAKARFLALKADGRSVASAAALVNVPERTAWRWWQRGREVAANETPALKDDWVRIVRRSQGIQHAVLDVAEDYAFIAQNDNPHPLAQISRFVAGRELLKNALTWNVYSGTGTDKLQKDSDQSQPKESTQVLIVLNCTTPQDVVDKAQDYIEGDARPAPEAAP